MTDVVVQQDRPFNRWGPLIGYIIVVAVLAFNLKLQSDTLESIQRVALSNSDKAELSACEVLDHRVSSRISFITIIGTLKAIAIAAATNGNDPSPKFARAAEAIVIPRSPSPELIAERDRVCADAEITPEKAFPNERRKSQFHKIGALALVSDFRELRCFRRSVQMSGTQEADIIFGTAQSDVIHGRAGSDSIFGLERNDRVCGGKGHDTLRGDQGFDRVFGGKGSDSCSGERVKGCEK